MTTTLRVTSIAICLAALVLAIIGSPWWSTAAIAGLTLSSATNPPTSD